MTRRRRRRWGYPIQMSLAVALVLIVAFFALGWYVPLAELGGRIFPG